jgi:hypothetical protein
MWIAQEPRLASSTTSPGILLGNRNALTRTEASTTTLGGIGLPFFVGHAQDFLFLRGRRVASSDRHPFQEYAILRHHGIQVIALAKTRGLAYLAGKSDPRRLSHLDQSQHRSPVRPRPSALIARSRPW